MSSIEILVINDGSTDKTQDIAIKYAKKFPNSIRVVNKRNGGHGSTINTGIPLSEGKYVRVLDGDDWLDTDELIDILPVLAQNDVDIIATNYTEVYPDGRRRERAIKHEFESKKQYCFEDVCGLISVLRFHSILYNRRLFNDNQIKKLDEYCYYVDIEYITYPIPYVNSIIFVDRSLYNYRVGNENQSVSKSSYLRNYKQHEHVTIEIASFYEINKERISWHKSEYIQRTACDMILKTFQIYSMMSKRQAKIAMQRFDSMLQAKAPSVYSDETDDRIRFIRWSRYNLIAIGIYDFIRQMRIKLGIRTRLKKWLNK